MFSTQPEVGSTANSYTILAKLATGGMAEIFLARTESAANVERYVVLKRVHRHRATDIKFVNMFLDEARLAAQLQHPNIAQVFDTGKLGDSYFFTMEYVHGETVRELMHRSFALCHTVPIGCGLTIIAGAAAGLQHAHDRVGNDGKHLGIVHRDVSPSNLMVTFEGNVKIVDFGVAKASHRSTETQSGTVKGKIGYMAPEQASGGIVDKRCDLFSLGIVMWELLVGDRLFKRESDFDSMAAVVRDRAPPPSSVRAGIPAEIDRIVLKLLEKSPDDRYQSAGELLEDIENAALRTGTGISVAGLRRYVRDLFGQRSEPWVELRMRDDKSEVVTVTGAPPVKSDTALDPIDKRLERVLDLSTSSVATVPVEVTPSSEDSPMRAATAPTVSERAAVLPRRPVTTEDAALPEAPGRGRWWLVLAGLAVVAGATMLAVTALPGSPLPVTSATPIVVVDAAAPVVQVDAFTQVDAPEQVAAEPAPPAVVDKAPEHAPPAKAARPAVKPARPAPPEDVATVYRAGRFDDVVASCSASARVLAANAVTCVLAACRRHDEAKARRWVASAPAAKRSALATACAAQDTQLEPPKPAEPANPPEPPKCDDSDPMSCRR